MAGWEASDLEEESESYERQGSRAVAANLGSRVQRLEAEQADQPIPGRCDPSGVLAKDFERYLRNQRTLPGVD